MTIKEELRRSPDRTKDSLIEAARYLFAQNGYAATSVKQIADKAKVNISLVSYHFGGKEGLYHACLESDVDGMIHFFERTVSLPLTSKEDFKLRLRLFIEEVFAHDLKSPETGCIIRRDIEMNTIDPAIFEIFKKTIVIMFEKFISFIRRGQEAGFLKKNVDPANVAVLFMGGIQHVIRTDALRKRLFGITVHDEKHRNDIINTALEMFFSGLDNK